MFAPNVLPFGDLLTIDPHPNVTIAVLGPKDVYEHLDPGSLLNGRSSHRHGWRSIRQEKDRDVVPLRIKARHGEHSRIASQVSKVGIGGREVIIVDADCWGLPGVVEGEQRDGQRKKVGGPANSHGGLCFVSRVGFNRAFRSFCLESVTHVGDKTLGTLDLKASCGPSRLSLGQTGVIPGVGGCYRITIPKLNDTAFGSPCPQTSARLRSEPSEDLRQNARSIFGLYQINFIVPLANKRDKLLNRAW